MFLIVITSPFTFGKAKVGPRNLFSLPGTALFETVITVESLYNQFLRSHYFDNSMAKKLSHKNRLGWVKP